MSRELVIDGTRIADDTHAWVIAEIGSNHQGSVDKCLELFDRAKECGVNAVKIQKRDNETLFTTAQANRPYTNENSFGSTYLEHRRALEFGKSEYQELIARANELGLTFFATAWDERSADFLADLNMPAFKIASASCTDTDLLRHVAKFDRPMIVSTGGATMDEVRRAHDTVREQTDKLALLQCTAQYPLPAEALNLRVIETYRQALPETVIGLSDHFPGITEGPVAYLLGARIFEKHFTFNRVMKGSDHIFSLEPIGMRRFVRDLHRTPGMLGDGIKEPQEGEVSAINKMRRTPVVTGDLPVGSILTEADLMLRVSGGGEPGYVSEQLLGRRLKQPLSAEAAVMRDMVE